MKSILCASLLTLTLASTAVAQGGSVRFYGPSCTDPATPPFRVLGVPRIGQDLIVETWASFQVSDAGGIRTILVGASDRLAHGVPLPFDIAPFSFGRDVYCGFLLQSAEASIPVPLLRTGPFDVQVPIRIPGDPGLVGATVYMQVLGQTYTSFVRSSTTTLTAGAAVTIGR